MQWMVRYSSEIRQFWTVTETQEGILFVSLGSLGRASQGAGKAAACACMHDEGARHVQFDFLIELHRA